MVEIKDKTKHMLTGKAKEDFIRWCYGLEPHEDLEDYERDYEKDFKLAHSARGMYPLIIEWMDSIDLVVDITPLGKDKFGYSLHSYVKGFTPSENEPRYSHVCKTREEATQTAIKTANNVYNSR